MYPTSPRWKRLNKKGRLLRTARLIGLAGVHLNEYPATVQIVQKQPVRFGRLLIDQPRDAGATVKTIVVKNDHAANNQSRPRPIQNIFRRLKNINIDMAESKRSAFTIPSKVSARNTRASGQDS